MKTAPLAGLITGITIASLFLLLFLPLILKRCRARKKQLGEDKDVEMNRGVDTEPRSPFTISSPTVSEASTPGSMSPTEAKRSNPSASGSSKMSTRSNLGGSGQVQAPAHRTLDEVDAHDSSTRLNFIDNEALPQDRQQSQAQEGTENTHWRDAIDSREDLTHTEKLVLASTHQLTSTSSLARTACASSPSPSSSSSSSSPSSFSFSSDSNFTHHPQTNQAPTTLPTATPPHYHPSPLAQHPTQPTTSPHASTRSPRTHGHHYAERIPPMSSPPAASRPIQRGEGGSFAQRIARSEASSGVGSERPHRERDGISRQRQTRGQSVGGLSFEEWYRMPGKEWPVDGWRGDRRDEERGEEMGA